MGVQFQVIYLSHIDCNLYNSGMLIVIFLWLYMYPQYSK